jgi:hypothetical protein
VCVYREANGSGLVCRIEGRPVDTEFCGRCPYILEEKRGFCAFLKGHSSDSDSILLFRRFCTRDQKVVWLNECCVCPHHT